MQKKIVTRCLSVAGVFVIIAFAGVASSVAAIPDNDNFANATIISAVPFVDAGDLSGTTTEPGEPAFCGAQQNTVWYKFTASANKAVRVTLTGTDSNVALNVYQSSGGGFFGLNFLNCAAGGGAPLQFNVSAGATYYFQAGSTFFAGSAHLQLTIEEIPPPINDNFAAAISIQSVPFSDNVDLSSATTESGEEVRPNGVFDTIVASAWYAITPNASQSLTVTGNAFCCVSPIVAVYTGGSLPTLTVVGAAAGFGQKVTFRANGGTTYYIQVGRGSFASGPPVVTIQVEATPPPIPGFTFNPNDPSRFDAVQFIDTSFDPAQAGMQAWMWNFGDGATATGRVVTHRYAADGDYSVTLTVTTFDGRTAFTSQTLHVKTHDVAIVKFTAPNAASAGQTRHVTVGVGNSLETELVQVTLYKSVPGTFDGFQVVGTLTQQVGSVASGNRTTSFDFSYTFTSDDAAIGKVTFKVVAALQGVRDAQPADNTAIAPSTKVSP